MEHSLAALDGYTVKPLPQLAPFWPTLLTGLEFLELNLAHGRNVDWTKLAQLPALHSLMMVPPISPHSSGHGPEHAQQVCAHLQLFGGRLLQVDAFRFHRLAVVSNVPPGSSSFFDFVRAAVHVCRSFRNSQG
jgi:hypothetical protein